MGRESAIPRPLFPVNRKRAFARLSLTLLFTLLPYRATDENAIQLDIMRVEHVACDLL